MVAEKGVKRTEGRIGFRFSWAIHRFDAYSKNETTIRYLTDFCCRFLTSLYVVLIDAENELQQMKDVSINHEPIELFKILKIEGLVSSGGMAKTVIADGQVLVNGIEETRKRKKIVAGDVVKFGDKEMKICLA